MEQRTTKLMTMHKVLHHRDYVDRLYVPRIVGGRGLPAMKMVLTHEYNDLKTAYKSVEEDRLQLEETILTNRGPTERQKSANKNGKKNNSMDALSDY